MIIISAPARISRGEGFDWSATVVGQNWTGYTGTVTFRRNRTLRFIQPDYGFIPTDSDPILVETVAGDAGGVLSFSLTPAQTLTFSALPRIGFFAQAKAEINMTNGTDVQKFQIRVSTSDSLT